jgi:hypothetical protein
LAQEQKSREIVVADIYFVCYGSPWLLHPKQAEQRISMQLILPPGVTASDFRQALAAFAAVVGSEWVLATGEDRETYLDEEK